SRQFEDYSKAFDKIVTQKREQAKLVKEVLDPSGAKLRTDFEDLQAAAAKAGVSNTEILAGEGLKHVMLARLNANKLIARHEQAASDAAEKAFADLKLVMGGIDAAIRVAEVRRLFDEIKVLANKYHETYL